ncbi:GNAT family N-acetyltransferase [Mesoterricola silvestris]|uniref:N-acetyltransferase n=1 Tax=Mesoterricola silvestris TaxID=2927979 RepID=A0AA48KAD3_9BACT|nr:GNAT family N-acetyltransferase [Mesoterricola silvestris]BDU73192.1 N-acetyltransferase [Mesoterricola silvestris]
MALTPSTHLRQAAPGDAPACGRICYEAFAALGLAHHFPCDFPSAEAAAGMLEGPFSDPGFHGMVALREGRIIGSVCLDERGPVVCLGPITVDPGAQNAGTGRRLMEAALERERGRGAAGVRLVQAAFHNRTMALYASLGFEVREPLSCMQGRTRTRGLPGCEVRPARPEDLDACDALALRVHGHQRRGDLERMIHAGQARLVEREGRITGYASALAFSGHATAEETLDLKALLASADGFQGPGILVPTRNADLFRWCLAEGLRVVQPMTLMSVGWYQEPAGAWLPSISS